MDIHTFDTSEEAYNFCQCNDKTDGDILVIQLEETVGIANTWPITVTLAKTELHTPTGNLTLDELDKSMNVLNKPGTEIDFVNSFKIAVLTAKNLDFDVNPYFLGELK